MNIIYPREYETVMDKDVNIENLNTSKTALINYILNIEMKKERKNRFN